jgi:ABC-type sulfate transport system permease component
MDFFWLLMVSSPLAGVAIAVWGATRGRTPSRAERIAYSLALLIAILALLWLVIRVLTIFSEIAEASDASQRFRIVSDGIIHAAAISLTCGFVALTIAVSVSIVAARKHRRQAAGKTTETRTADAGR